MKRPGPDSTGLTGFRIDKLFKIFLFPVCIIVFSLFFLSCAGSPEFYRNIDEEVNTASYSTALSEMEGKKLIKNLYPPKNAVLYHLDRGMIEHYAGLWKESSGNLETAERLIEDAFTKSITQEIGSFVTNDNTRDYAGEDYEDLYINVFNSLNYYHRDNLEGAMVEIRRLNEKLLYLSSRYERSKKKILDSENVSNEYTVEALKYSNSALARYLGVLFYRARGNADSARIDMEKLQEAYELAPSVYYNPPPLSLEDELEIPEGKARLNIISFSGLSPVKEEIFLDFSMPNSWIRVALPQMINRPSAIRSIEAILFFGDRYERIEMELLEDMSMVAKETFKSNYNLILLKTIARFIIKNGVSAGLMVASESSRDDDSGLSLTLAILSILSQVFAGASERADVRLSRYFPAFAHVGAVNVDPGIYSLQINYYGNSGLVYSETKENIEITEGRLNLWEFVCLK